MAAEVVIVAGTFTVDPARRAEFLEGRLESIRASREDAGCLEYTMSADAVDSGLVRLFEMWTSPADLQAHVQRIQSSQPTGGGVPVLARDMKIYVHAEERPFGV
ncbi:MAG TPA: antibiotic biosynthesis monooxygenase [Acidimicrobiales bacterium]|jgi:quinol monooxygenase YgiN|nr:antibiotic biosynthesis monooxygenase [Acidimicrobiales bacterium]